MSVAEVPNPMCWYWPTEQPTEQDVRRRFFEQAERTGHTPGQAQVLWDLERAAERLVGDEGDVLARWQDGRCAVCGRHADLVCDHDHATGLVRGWLCRSCNATEGRNQQPDTIFTRYRERPPAAILGLVVRYLDPVAGEYAQPQTTRAVEPADKWVDAASEGIL